MGRKEAIYFLEEEEGAAEEEGFEFVAFFGEVDEFFFSASLLSWSSESLPSFCL